MKKDLAYHYSQFENMLGNEGLRHEFREFLGKHSPREVFLWLHDLSGTGRISNVTNAEMLKAMEEFYCDYVE